MANVFKRIYNQYHYAKESIRNRYPCKIIKINNLNDFNKISEIQYQAVSKINVRNSTVQNLLEDPLLVEKFHPTDGVKLGFLACGEILLKKNHSIEEARDLYLKIINTMF